jgi:hypothetical protein
VAFAADVVDVVGIVVCLWVCAAVFSRSEEQQVIVANQSLLIHGLLKVK